MKRRELIEFCERIEKGGKPEQQYVAQGIRELLATAAEEEQMKIAETKSNKEADRGLFPKSFPEKGYIVELPDGSMWTVEEVCYRCRQKKQASNDDGKIRFSIENMSYDFTAEDLSDGSVTVYGKEKTR